MSENGSVNGWREYQKLVLSELERHNGLLEEVNSKIQFIHQDHLANMKTEIALLKFKCGIYGAIAGLIPGVGSVIFILLKGSSG